MHSLQCRHILGGRKLVNWIATMKLPSLILWQRKIGESRNNNPYGRPPPPSPWLAPFLPLFGSFNMALSWLKPFVRARWKRLHCRLYYALVNSSCTQPPPPPPRLTPGHYHFLCLGWQIPRCGVSWAVKSPAVGTKKEGKCPVIHQHCNIFHWSHNRIVPI